ncbi:MAG: universal stress protein [Syntrophobacteraceae bacterium]
MSKNLLIAVTGDYKSMWSVRFVAEFFKNPESLNCSLLHISAMDGSNSNKLAAFQKKGEETLRKTAAFLVKRGLCKKNITPILKFQKFGTAADIVNEGIAGGFDAVVLGRRGLTRFQELFEKSIVSKLMEERLHIPVWTCRKPALSTKNVLLCADGSEQSMRAAEHVARMVTDEPRHFISILHVLVPDKKELLDPDSIIDQTRSVLQGAGIPDKRIREIAERGSSPANVILDKANKYKYAAVAMGRSGADHAPLRDIFMGSASTKVLRSLTSAAAWLVP